MSLRPWEPKPHGFVGFGDSMVSGEEDLRLQMQLDLERILDEEEKAIHTLIARIFGQDAHRRCDTVAASIGGSPQVIVELDSFLFSVVTRYDAGDDEEEGAAVLMGAATLGTNGMPMDWMEVNRPADLARCIHERERVVASPKGYGDEDAEAEPGG